VLVSSCYVLLRWLLEFVAEGCINSDLGLARLAANTESDWPSA